MFHFTFRPDDPARFDEQSLLPRMRALMKLSDFTPDIIAIGHWVVEGVLVPKPNARALTSAYERRFVKRAFPRPVPMVRIPQRSTSRMHGVSLNPCTTASLCMSTTVGAPSISGMSARRRSGRLKWPLPPVAARKIMAAPFDRSVVPYHAWAANPDQRGKLQIVFLCPAGKRA